MSKINSTFQCITCYYDFAISGGALANGITIGTLPIYSRVYYCTITPRAVPTSATNLAQISVGWLETGKTPQGQSFTAFFPITLPPAFTLNVPLAYPVLFVSPEGYTNISRDIQLFSQVENLTGGRLQIDLWYVQTEN